MFNLCLYFVPLHMSTYNKDDIITIIIYFRLPLVVFANIKFNINKIRWSYLKKRLFFYSIYNFLAYSMNKFTI